jgi:hypothetical protein
LRTSLLSSEFARTLFALFDDLRLLASQEITLAKREISLALADQMKAAIYFLISAVLALITAFMLCQTAAYALVAAGLAAPWAYLIVTVVVGGLASLSFFMGKANLTRPQFPDHTIQQIKQDISAVKDALS